MNTPVLSEIHPGSEHGSRALVERWLEKYGFKIRNYVSKVMMVRKYDLDNIMQEVWMRVFRAASRFEYVDDKRESSWLFTIATRTIKDHLSSQNAINGQGAKEVGEGDSADVPDSYLDAQISRISPPEARHSYAELREILKDVLTERQLDILLLQAEEGMSHRELAKRFEISVSNVSSYLRAARAKLYRSIELRNW